jgi:hypothetical protein
LAFLVCGGPGSTTDAGASESCAQYATAVTQRNLTGIVKIKKNKKKIKKEARFCIFLKGFLLVMGKIAGAF